MNYPKVLAAATATLFITLPWLTAQDVANPPRSELPEGQRGSDAATGDRRIFRGGGPGPMAQEIKLLDKFDKDGDEHLDADERKAAREFLAKERAEGRLGRGFPGRGGGPRPGAEAPAPGRVELAPNPPAGGEPGAAPGGGREAGGGGPRPQFGPGGGGFGRRNAPPAQPGPKVGPADVKAYPAKPLYDPLTVRTFFLEFAESDWEKELAEFKGTDVLVPAKLTVDGKTYKDAVGVHFRGMSSFMMVGEGYKRSLGITLDYANDKQDIKGYSHLDLLNSHEDPSFMRAVLFNQIAREYLPAPKSNFVRVVINGESWGIYQNVQHFTKDFLQEWYGTKKGVRWKVLGSPGARGGLEFVGEDPEQYRSRFELKSKEDPKAWKDLINLCRVLNETPADQLVEKLSPILDIDEALRFLALDNALINNDGYWIRSSDYCMYEDQSGQFHILPRDTNETFGRPGGPGFGGRGGPGGRRDAGGSPGSAPPPAEGGAPQPPAEPPRPQGEDVLRSGPGPAGGGGGFPRGPQVKGVELDPLVAANDAAKPLASKLLAVPELRQRYLGYVRDIAEKWLDWEKLGPISKQYAALIAEEVKSDTRKLESLEAFERSIEGSAAESEPGRGPGREISLKEFAQQRRAYLLSYPAIQALAHPEGSPR